MTKTRAGGLGLYLVFRISYVGCPPCGRRIALGLGLIGFVFLGGAERDIGVNLCGIRGCGGFGL